MSVARRLKFVNYRVSVSDHVFAQRMLRHSRPQWRPGGGQGATRGRQDKRPGAACRFARIKSGKINSWNTTERRRGLLQLLKCLDIILECLNALIPVFVGYICCKV